MLNQYLQDNIIIRGSFRFVHCPEVVDLYCGSDIEDEMLNKKYEFMKRDREAKLAAGDFDGYIWRTERPYRLSAFLEVVGADKCKYSALAKLFLEIWIDSELPNAHNLKVWRGLFDTFRNSPVLTSTKKHLPDRFKVYRGGSAKGMSWTLDEAVARKFANMPYRKTKEVQCREVSRDEVVCYLDSRGEKEIILL